MTKIIMTALGIILMYCLISPYAFAAKYHCMQKDFQTGECVAWELIP